MAENGKGNGKIVTLYVGNLPYSVTAEKLREIFSAHGSVKDARVVKDDSERSRGFGFVEMPEAEAEKAITALNKTQLEGRALMVNKAKQPNGSVSEEKEDESRFLFTNPNVSPPLQLGKNSWHSQATVQLRPRHRRGRVSLANVTVFFCWGDRDQTFATTDERGVAIADLNFTESGSYRVWAGAEDDPESQVFTSVVVREKTDEEIALDQAKHKADLAEQKARKAVAEQRVREAGKGEKEKTPEEIELERIRREAEKTRADAEKTKADKDLLQARREEKGPQPIPHELSVAISGSKGNYRLAVSVLTKENAPVPRATIILMDSHSEDPARTLTLEDNGALIIPLNFQERERFITITAPGVEKPWKSRLFGPRRTAQIYVPGDLHQWPNS